MLPRRTLLLAGSALLAGCSPVNLLNDTVPDNGVSVARDIAYLPGARHTLDIYRPRGTASPMPVAVFLYGGGWTSGAKSEYGFVAEPLARRGVLVVVPDYRLYPQVVFPAFVQDCAAAVAWTLQHAASYGGNPSRLFVVGHSAGAYNATMLGLDATFLAATGTSRAALAGVVGLAGPYDFLPITEPDVRPIFASVQDGPASQPITYVDGHNKPMLLLAGTDDETVQPRNTTALAARIRQAGGPVQDRIYPGIGHIGLITAFAPLFQGRAPVLRDVAAFLGGGRKQALLF